MPIGIMVNTSCYLAGSLLGSKFGKYMPAKMQKSLVLMIGYCTIAIGLVLTVKASSLPVLILSLMLGTFLGELINIEDKIKNGLAKLKNKLANRFSVKVFSDENYIEKYISLLMLFCTGSTGMLGALTEGMTGDNTILLTKSAIDIVASASFAATMGIFITTIAIPQFSLFMLLFGLAGFIVPLTSPAIIADFTACGGVIAIITGLRVCEIKDMRVTNTIPALVIVMPISWIWSLLF